MDIKSFLRSVLLSPEIVILTGDKTVHFLHAASPIPPYIEYEIYDEEGALYTEGKEVATDYYIQVDIFSETDYSDIEERVKEKMLSAGFEGGHGPDLYEKDTKLYHKPLRFNYTVNIE